MRSVFWHISQSHASGRAMQIKPDAAPLPMLLARSGKERILHCNPEPTGLVAAQRRIRSKGHARFNQ
jgi:hypothetical protein